MSPLLLQRLMQTAARRSFSLYAACSMLYNVLNGLVGNERVGYRWFKSVDAGASAISSLYCI